MPAGFTAQKRSNGNSDSDTFRFLVHARSAGSAATQSTHEKPDPARLPGFAERGGEVRQLKGIPDRWRLRVGDWRVIFRYDAEGRVVSVLTVLHRSEAYR